MVGKEESGTKAQKINFSVDTPFTCNMLSLYLYSSMMYFGVQIYISNEVPSGILNPLKRLLSGVGIEFFVSEKVFVPA